MCNSLKQDFHGRLLARYCSIVVEMEFRENSLGMTRQTAMCIFTQTYNEAFEFMNFWMTRKLLHRGIYFPPCCMLVQFESLYTMIDLQHLKPFLTECSLKGTGMEPSQSQGSYEITGEGCCDICYEPFSDCHNCLFPTYYLLTIKHQPKTFPEAMLNIDVQHYYI